MSFSQSDIDSLEKAIASGTKKVKYNDREIEYRSLNEMKESLAMMKNRLNNNTRKPYTYSRYDRGYQ